LVTWVVAPCALALQPVEYLLEYRSGDPFIEVTIQIPEDAREHSNTLVIPRSAPGTYAYTNYSAFVESVRATAVTGAVLKGKQGLGSYYTFASDGQALAAITYRVDLKRMEATLTSGSDASKLRDGYVGLLGYSVFGYANELVNRPVKLAIRTSADWPIFSTLAPRVDRPTGHTEFTAASFAELADAQYLLGGKVRVARLPKAPIPLYVAVYSEVEADLDEIGRRALLALNGLAKYFGYVPMPHYTIVLEYLVPPTPAHHYGFWMEHLNSMTGANAASNAIKGYEEDPEIGGMVHHMAHSWVPLRCYGEGYRPFEWQVAPLIDTVWLNEGFAWYIAYYNVLDKSKVLDFFRRTLDEAPEFIRQLSLRDLSRLGSTQYGEDFRIGKNLFSRGALMAHDIDLEVQRKTEGAKSFRDVLLGLLHWTEANQRAFRYEEIEPIMSKSAGVDLSKIWERWQRAPAEAGQQSRSESATR